MAVKELGSPILTLHEVDEPWGVVINQRGEVIVSEWGAHCVSVFSPSGEKILSFGKKGSGHGQFQHPRGVAVDGEGNILVMDNANNRIQKFTAEGHFPKTVGSNDSGPQQFFYTLLESCSTSACT